jgi:hypothetical protein
MIKAFAGNQTGIIDASSLKHLIINGQRLATGTPIEIKISDGQVIFILAAYGSISTLTEDGVETFLRPSGVLQHPLRFDKTVQITGANLGIVYFIASAT